MPRLAYHAAVTWTMSAGQSQTLIVVPPGNYGTELHYFGVTMGLTSFLGENYSAVFHFSDGSTFNLGNFSGAFIFASRLPWAPLIQNGFTISVTMPDPFVLFGRLTANGAMALALITFDPGEPLTGALFVGTSPDPFINGSASPRLPSTDQFGQPQPYLVTGAWASAFDLIQAVYPPPIPPVPPSWSSGSFPNGGQYEAFESLFAYPPFAEVPNFGPQIAISSAFWSVGDPSAEQYTIEPSPVVITVDNFNFPPLTNLPVQATALVFTSFSTTAAVSRRGRSFAQVIG